MLQNTQEQKEAARPYRFYRGEFFGPGKVFFGLTGTLYGRARKPRQGGPSLPVRSNGATELHELSEATSVYLCWHDRLSMVRTGRSYAFGLRSG